MSYFKVLVIIIFSFMLFFTQTTQAENKNLSLELQNSNLSDAIRLIAKFLGRNVMISPSVQGVVTMHLSNAAPLHAFDLLLATQGLAKWKIGNVWFIGPHDELIKRKQEEMKWQDTWNESLPLKTEVWQIKYGSAENIANLLQDGQASLMSKRGRVRIDTRTNILCIQDIAERIESMRRLIRILDVPVRQIQIEARLVSVDNDFERDLGVRFAVLASSSNADHNVSGLFPRQETNQYSLAIARLADGSLLDVKLSALENAGHAELLSSPSLFTANQQPASIEAGEEVPYQEVSESGGTAIAFKKAVLGLKVTPQVLPGNRVLLQLQINQDRPSSRMVQGVPAISTRQIITNVLVKSGETIVLGGIYERGQENAEDRVPFISQVPVIGLLFKQTKKRENKRELLIFVTPNIIAQET